MSVWNIPGFLRVSCDYTILVVLYTIRRVI
nr:MAG TPA: hypothetical protein [Caudoviricetes sp.]